MISEDNKLHRASRKERYKPIVKEEPKEKTFFSWENLDNLLFDKEPKKKRKPYKTKKKK